MRLNVNGFTSLVIVSQDNPFKLGVTNTKIAKATICWRQSITSHSLAIQKNRIGSGGKRSNFLVDPSIAFHPPWLPGSIVVQGPGSFGQLKPRSLSIISQSLISFSFKVLPFRSFSSYGYVPVLPRLSLV